MQNTITKPQTPHPVAGRMWKLLDSQSERRQGPTQELTVSVGQKLTLSFLSLAIMVGVLGFLGYSSMRKTAEQLATINAANRTEAAIYASLEGLV